MAIVTESAGPAAISVDGGTSWLHPGSPGYDEALLGMSLAAEVPDNTSTAPMRTVKWLRDELAKFPDDAVCYAYEGEITGIVIEHSGQRGGAQGVIHCSESGRHKGRETELLPPQ